MTNSDSIKIQRSYKFRCTPNRAQQKQLVIEFGHTRYVWNWALETRNKAYQARQESLNVHLPLCSPVENGSATFE